MLTCLLHMLQVACKEIEGKCPPSGMHLGMTYWGIQFGLCMSGERAMRRC